MPVPGQDEVADLFEEERALHQLLSQETRHYIVQFILAHPDHLMSLAELDYAIPGKATASISTQLDRLIEEDIVAEYIHGPSERKRDLPSQFYGFTEHGIEVLDQFGYLEAVPILRALYDNMEKSTRVQRHEESPRPDQSAAVVLALAFDEDIETEWERPETNEVTSATGLGSEAIRSNDGDDQERPDDERGEPVDIVDD